MLILAAIAALSSAEPPAQQRAAPVAAQRQAQATVRILRPVELRFAEIETTSPDRLRDTVVRSADGRLEPARLVEFE